MSSFEAFRYDGKRVVVVGGATGMGAAAADLARDAGAEVVVMDLAPVRSTGVRAISVNLARSSGWALGRTIAPRSGSSRSRRRAGLSAPLPGERSRRGDHRNYTRLRRRLVQLGDTGSFPPATFIADILLNR